MAESLTHKGIGENVSPLTKDVIQFISSRSESISNTEILMNSDQYREYSSNINITLHKLKGALANNKEILKQLDDLEEAINDSELEVRYYIYKRGYQDALKSLFCLMAG